MNKALLLKFIAMGGIALILMIPMTMINSLIQERGNYRHSVMRDIANSTSRRQILSGPLLVVPYTKTETQWRKSEDEKSAKAYTTEVKGQLFFLPGKLAVGAQLKTELRQRGIYQATLYHADIKMSGHFNVPQDYGIQSDLESYTFHRPFVSLGIEDVRGIESAIDFSFLGKNKEVRPGSLIKAFPSGVHAPILQQSKQVDELGQMSFDLSFQLQGTSGIAILQLGEETEIQMTSDWPHPSFQGNYLPSSHEISEEGFTAQWFSSHFSNNVQQNLPACAEYAQCDELFFSAAKVDLINPVDHYVKSDRATKYALLFICLTFAGFFLFEILKQLKIHPIQYLLVGVSLAAFYLLLISLSEHIGFAWAYLISAAACIALIGFYLVHILNSLGRSVVFAFGLGLLYALLYGVMGSEDYALLMGTILLFAVLSLFMVVSRKLDWYSVAKDHFPLESSRMVDRPGQSA